jgi:hypothetical protein
MITTLPPFHYERSKEKLIQLLCFTETFYHLYNFEQEMRRKISQRDDTM